MKLRLPVFAAAFAVSLACAESARSFDSSNSSGHSVLNNSTIPSLEPLNQLSSVLPSAGQGSCLGLPRNTVLSSCPAPCLPDAPCIVYDQDAAHTQLTGCDYDTSSSESFCASAPSQECEFHCFAASKTKSAFAFYVFPKWPTLELPRPRTDPSLATTPTDTVARQISNFVIAFGKLNLSEDVSEASINGDYNVVELAHDVGVDPALLANAPSVTTLKIANLALSSDRLAAVIASAPSKLIHLQLEQTNLTALSGEILRSLPKLETLFLIQNPISRIAWDDFSLPSLKSMGVMSNKLTGFGVRAPMLQELFLSDCMLARIPESVFTYTKLRTLDLYNNPIIQPLVLTARQVQFLNELPELSIKLVEPPDAAIISRLPVGGETIYGNYSDDTDLSLLVTEALKTFLHGDPTLPVLVVGSEEAETYNNLLETRARIREEAVSRINGDADSNIPEVDVSTELFIDGPSVEIVPTDICSGVPRNTLLSYCAEGYCPRNGACVAYEPPTLMSQRSSGCDFSATSGASFCTRANTSAKTCEFQCFAAYQPQSQFKFFIPFKSDAGQATTRQPYQDGLVGLTTTEIPYLSSRFVDKIGPLNLTSIVTEVWIAGGQSETAPSGLLADVIVSSKLLSKALSVTSLSLLNIDLSKSDLGAVIASAPRKLKSLNLRNTNLSTLPEDVIVNLQQLESLILAQNTLSSLDIQAEALTKLDLSANALTTLGIEAPTLETLDLSRNNLVRIPLSVFTLERLKTLNLEDNLLAFPLVLSSLQAAFLDSMVNLKLSQHSRSDTAAESLRVQSEILWTDSQLQVNGSTVMVKGVAVIIVSEQIANGFNDQLEQMQHELIRDSPTASTGTSIKSTGTARSSLSGSSSTGSSQENRISASTQLANETEGKASRAGGSNSSPMQSDGTSPARRHDTVAPIEASSESVMTILSVGGLGSTFFIAVVVLFIVIKRRKTGVNKGSSYATLTDTDDASTNHSMRSSPRPVVPWWRDDDMLSHRVNASDIGDLRVIGGGASGIVWLVNYRVKTRQLVSKRVVKSEVSAHESKVVQLFLEAKIASWLCFPSIVPFVGVAWTDKTDLQVLYEYMPNGDLGSYLARTDASTLPWLPDKLQLAIDIIEALVYTHSFNPPLLHRDLKSSNVLLDGDFKAKLGGFGSARPESENDTMTTSGIGTGRWLAPEILSGSTSYGPSSDIYSFAVILCELDTHQVPYAVEGMVYSEAGLMQRVARGALRPSVLASCPPEIREIAEACVAFNPDERPNAMQVAYSLRSLRRQEAQDQ